MLYKICGRTLLLVMLFLLNSLEFSVAQERNTPIAPDEFLKMKNPLAITTEQGEDTKKLYKKKCKKCHGSKGNGRGSATRGMDIKPRDYTDRNLMSEIPDGQLFWIITNGSDPDTTEMEGYKDQLTDEQIWQLIHHIRLLAQENPQD
jgi:mono/diheme cytochrome c family protein